MAINATLKACRRMKQSFFFLLLEQSISTINPSIANIAEIIAIFITFLASAPTAIRRGAY
jgi:membrane protein insertase Oxa1/YidC/SpoIIIJ